MKHRNTRHNPMTWKIVLIICALLLAFCVYNSREQFELVGTSKSKLAELSGKIDIRFAAYKGKYWLCALEKGRLLCSAVTNPSNDFLITSPNLYSFENKPEGIPSVQGFVYHGAYSVSPDKTLIVLSGKYKPHIMENPHETDYVLIQAKDGAVVFIRENDLRFTVVDIAWSPDSSKFAVLEDSSSLSFGLYGILGIFFAHPSYVYKFYLTVYDRNGNLIVERVRVASQLLDGAGVILWKSE